MNLAFTKGQFVTFEGGHEAHGLKCKVSFIGSSDTVWLRVPGYGTDYEYPNDLLISWDEYMLMKNGVVANEGG